MMSAEKIIGRKMKKFQKPLDKSKALWYHNEAPEKGVQTLVKCLDMRP